MESFYEHLMGFLYPEDTACLKKVRNVMTVDLLEFDPIAVTVQYRDTLAVVLQTGEQDWLLSFLAPDVVHPDPGEDVLQSLGVGLDGGQQDGSLHDVLRHLQVSRAVRVVARLTVGPV